MTRTHAIELPAIEYDAPEDRHLAELGEEELGSLAFEIESALELIAEAMAILAAEQKAAQQALGRVQAARLAFSLFPAEDDA